MIKTNNLQGCVALVTGGAGGLGSAICMELATAGASVIIGYNHSSEAAQALLEKLPIVSGAKHSALQAIVTDSAQLSTLADTIDDSYGKCDIVVNCAGVTRFVEHRDLKQLDDELFDKILATNVRGPFAVVRAMHPLLEKSSKALIVNLSSIASVTAMGSNIAYCASKAAVDNMTRSLARALAPKIRVISVAPGLSDTDFIKSMDASWRNEQELKTPLQRLASPKEIGLAVVSCATQLTFTTGAIIPVDGGRPLS